MQDRYPFLALVAVVLRMAAIPGAIVGAGGGLLVIALAVQGGVAGFATLPAVGLGMVIVLGSLLSALVAAALADLVDLLISIERNVRRRPRHPDEADESDEPEGLHW